MNKEQIELIIRQKFVNAPPDIKSQFPEMLRKSQLSWITFNTNEYRMLSFMDLSDEKERVKQLLELQRDPYPGLIVVKPNVKAAFIIEKSKNIYLKNNYVKHLPSISIGKDSTILVEKHRQVINTKDYGNLDYTIEIGFIVSFGDEITQENASFYLEDLISFSISKWRLGDA